MSEDRKAVGTNGVRFDALVDWSTLPGLRTLSDPDGAVQSARVHLEKGGRGGVKNNEAMAAAAREAAFDAAMERVNLSDAMAAAREKRRAGMRIGAASARKTADQIAEDKAEEARRVREARWTAEGRGEFARRAGPRRDGFAYLVACDALPEICVRAGHDLDRIMTAVEAGVFAASDPDTLATGGVKASGRRGAPQFMAVEGYCDRYLPWARRLMAPEYRRAGLTGRAVLAVVVAVVRDGRSTRDMDAEVGKRNGTAMGLLCDGLREYARVAGWTSRKEGG